MNVPLTGRTHRGLAFAKLGDGPPLVLLHGVGSSRSAWGPVLDRLADSHTVYALDLPGHGDSESLAAGASWTPRQLAEVVASALDEWGAGAPHVAGHSVGAWVALDLANLRPVASLTLLAPAGLWKKRQPLYCAVSLHLTWAGCRFSPRLLSTLSRRAWGRTLLFSQLFAHPELLSHDEMMRDVATLGRSQGFLPTMRACAPIRYQAEQDVDVPVTVAFGDSDRLLLRWQSRFTDQLPPHTRHVVLPEAGHVSMSDAPESVLRVILETTEAMAS